MTKSKLFGRKVPSDPAGITDLMAMIKVTGMGKKLVLAGNRLTESAIHPGTLERLTDKNQIVVSIIQNKKGTWSWDARHPEERTQIGQLISSGAAPTRDTALSAAYDALVFQAGYTIFRDGGEGTVTLEHDEESTTDSDSSEYLDPFWEQPEKTDEGEPEVTWADVGPIPAPVELPPAPPVSIDEARARWRK